MSDDLDTDMTAEPDPDFEAFVRVALADPQPADVFERTLALFELASIDAELAELLAEEAAEPELAGVRSTVSVTTFTFAAGDVTIEIEYDGDRIDGQIFPAATAEIALIGADGRRIVAATNSVGTFAIDHAADAAHGTWCLSVTTPSGSVRTPWFTL
jgi:hypothetical protein